MAHGSGLDGKRVVNNDGVHPPADGAQARMLTKGVHKVSVEFFQAGGGAELSVQIEAPGWQSRSGRIVAVTEAALQKKPVVGARPMTTTP